MRVLVIDDRERILLFRDSDLGLTPVPHWWITPGGGVDPGERDEQAAVREIEEETGLVISEGDLVGPLAIRTVLHGYSDRVVTQAEVFWVVRTPAFEVSTTGHTAEERETMTAHLWWTREELLAADEPIWPADLAALWDHAARGGPALDLGVVEESTVPA